MPRRQFGRGSAVLGNCLHSWTAQPSCWCDGPVALLVDCMEPEGQDGPALRHSVVVRSGRILQRCKVIFFPVVVRNRAVVIEASADWRSIEDIVHIVRRGVVWACESQARHGRKVAFLVEAIIPPAFFREPVNLRIVLREHSIANLSTEVWQASGTDIGVGRGCSTPS